MAVFEIQGPDGALYEVDAPDEAAAIAGFQKMNGGGGPDGAPDPEIAAYTSKVMGSDPAEAGKAVAREEGRRAGLESSPGQTVGAGLQKGTLRNFSDEMAGLAGASGLPVGVPPIITAPVGAYKLLTGDEGAQTRYDQTQERARGYYEGMTEANPISSYGSQIAGGIASPARGVGGFAAEGALYGIGDGETTEGRLTGGAIGGAVGGTVGAVANRLFRPRPPQAGGGGNAVVQAADELGVDLPMAAATDNRAIQWAGGVARNVPLAGTPLRESAERATAQIDDAARGIATRLGTGSADDAGAAVRQGVNREIGERLSGRTEQLYDDVANSIDQELTTPLTRTRQITQNIMAQRAASARPPGPAIGLVGEAIEREGGLTYQGIRELRTSIGELLGNPQTLPADMRRADLERLYGALSEDLRSAVQNAGGPQALRTFERANTYARGATARRQRLAKIIGRDALAKSDEAIFDKVTKLAGSSSTGDARTLWQVRRALAPEEWDSVTSAVVQRLGRAAPDAEFSPLRFMTQIQKMSDAGRHALLGGEGRGDVTRQVEALVTISQRFRQLQQYANPSGTGQTVMGGAIGTGLMMDPVSMIAQVTGAAVFARILARPATARAATQYARAYEMAVRRPGRAATEMLRRAAQQFGERVQELGVSVNPADLMGNLRPGYAEGDQKQ